MVWARLRTLRKRRGWTQSDLAKQCSVSPQVISNWERQYSTPDANAVARLADIFDVSVDYLMGREDDDSPVRIDKAHASDEISLGQVYPESRGFFPHRLRTIRSQRGISTLDLATALGVSTKTIDDWETQRAEPTLQNILSLTLYFGVSIDFMVGKTDDPNPEMKFTRLDRLPEDENYVTLHIEPNDHSDSAEFLRALVDADPSELRTIAEFWKVWKNSRNN